MSKELSYTQKLKYLEILMERDGGYKCWYCGKKLKINEHIFEHLDDDRSDNRLSNLVLSCQSCNVTKQTDEKLQDRALEKIKQNEIDMSVREKDVKKILQSKNQKTVNESGSKEIEINEKNFDIVENFIEDRLRSWGSIEFKDTIDSCTYLCRKKTGHGSQVCVRRYIDTLVSSVGPYEIIKENKKKLIVRKKPPKLENPSSFTSATC